MQMLVRVTMLAQLTDSLFPFNSLLWPELQEASFF
jgi:hypothetical protein